MKKNNDESKQQIKTTHPVPLNINEMKKVIDNISLLGSDLLGLYLNGKVPERDYDELKYRLEEIDNAIQASWSDLLKIHSEQLGK